ncbi:AAA family ATPase [Methanospirillum stamsii]|uniref:ATPase n=1 Tax=Methanospirillum stamsii TaxID=1277351 RepID=A0A2V2N5H4_9EURY|nr:MoxR family ATPase [Methanospirillum stamsii]PWR71758.1 ATPase [Methanospirillum stamsii]
MSDQNDSIQKIVDIHREVHEKVGEFIVGNKNLIDLILIGLLTEGHILIEGAPGTAKTSISKIISLITGCDFKRIQGAIDLQPMDMIGVNIYDSSTHDFVFRKGPIFTNILLTDELNRINPKSQSAFIEALSERQATVDGAVYPLPSPFIVIATQNPYELEGTFPLIEVQRDRFSFSTTTTFLGHEDELEIIRRASTGILEWDNYIQNIRPIIEHETLLSLIQSIKKITIQDPVHRYIRDIIMATRHHQDISLGASSRGSIAMVNGAKCLAALHGRDFVIPDDIKWLTPFVLLHRIYLTRNAEMDGVKVIDIIQEILETIEVP